jgi:hypothetical protein
LALFEKISYFFADLLENFDGMCAHMTKKFYNEDAEKSNFSNQMQFRKRSNGPSKTKTRLAMEIEPVKGSALLLKAFTASALTEAST